MYEFHLGLVDDMAIAHAKTFLMPTDWTQILKHFKILLLYIFLLLNFLFQYIIKNTVTDIILLSHRESFVI